MRISDWSSDVCSSDLVPGPRRFRTRSIDDEDDHVGGQQAAQRVEQILLGNKDARATVIEDIGDLGRREMPVYRHGISADMLGAEHRLDKGDSIGEKDRDAAYGANARRDRTSVGLGKRL